MRFLFYVYLVVRFWAFITYNNLEGIEHVVPYFYIVAVLDALFCFYEAREMVLCKLASLVLIVVMITYLSIVFVWFIRQFDQSVESILVLDIARASVYLVFSLIDFTYYGTGLKELYAQDR